ncbi:membrane integrity-associated transporter subunit PqiC [Erwinia psidii]|uniref:Membrane integrity-associated transporter subunit PqiC n=1 Tax=Erwinia psidii TaxID=69224 RepID=A0A3N6UQC1_9GAMM|nr:membrane integrity-associated transporter subunit PqiC [Erwinia psidii]MCX8957421.1 membrane integrity-associated transporter subunit PqiC [Erwinia psidii]MCX8959791.1 membrane integrity-associated transporter subunit PqiC [Erwinia psidii]MCX8964735.1 membrane integrity-associated transporter subunit PqiC [Erwinia psidii]RQM38159.1 membrane integrity-associated transporter subunit PqiC [Erwinia psidii]
MIKWIPVALALILTACSSTPETTWYQLPSAQKGTVATSNNGLRPAVFVQHVAVPDYLAGNGLVYQSSDVKYVIASNNLWASPLDQQLQQTLIANLSSQLPGWLVSGSPLGQQHDTLNVNISGFHGRYDGHAVISGDWVLEHQGQILKRSFALTIPQKEDGYDALVRALAQGWQQEAQQMADGIRNVASQ